MVSPAAPWISISLPVMDQAMMASSPNAAPAARAR
jgi:hypothetical protein